MDYFSVIVLVIVTFVFISDRSVKSIEQLNKTNNELRKKINDIKGKIQVIELENSITNYSELIELVEKTTGEYILLKNKKISLNDVCIDTVIANYLICNKNVCGFNLLYQYKKRKWSLKNIYVDIINYLNIFNKNDLSTYGIIICSNNFLKMNKSDFNSQLTSYTPSKYTVIELNDLEIKYSYLKKIYINKLIRADISIIIKILLLIISGSIITTNLIYSILNTNNINGLIIPSIIYYCYSYIIRYIYRPIGKKRIFASYIFPIYFIAYIIVLISTFTSKVIKRINKE